MRLDVMERVVLLGLLPQEASFLTLKLLRSVKENLSFDDKEHKTLGFSTANGMTLWDQEAAKKMKTKEVLIGEIITALIVKALTKLNTDEKLKEEHYTLYEKFIEGDTQKAPKKKAAKKSKK